MSPTTAGIDAQALRTHLMAPEPTRRVRALHALETEAGRTCATAKPRLAGDVGRFAARGIPFYAPNEEQYRAWVDRAVAYWERLHRVAAAA